MPIQKQSCDRQPLLMSVRAAAECRTRNDRQSYFAITRELAKAQFVLADSELSRRLWQDVADRDLEVGRILHLLYGGWAFENDEDMLEADQQFLALETL
jgi:hypothetical protein|tara:strand:+ start:365 stop:661 length:297 start_codon:yes stop_codon:yes gene_type:complete